MIKFNKIKNKNKMIFLIYIMKKRKFKKFQELF